MDNFQQNASIPPYYNNGFSSRAFRARQQKREIRFIGSLLGCAIILFVLINNLFAGILMATGMYDAYRSDPTLQFSLDIIVTFVSILLPFLLMGKLISKRVVFPSIAPLNAPSDPVTTVLAVFSGLGLCMLGNIVTSWIVAGSQLIGHEFTAPELNYPEGIGGFALSVLRVAVVAAICEELSFRGVSLQPLRKHGEWFAVICSACIFGLLHGNLVQAPFAIIAGIGLGWVCIKTKSIWAPMAVHFLNNFFSIAMAYLLKSAPDENGALIIESVILYSVLAVGVVCGVFFVRRARRIPTRYSFPQYLSTAQKAFAFFVNVPMLIAIAYMIFQTTLFIK